MSPRETLFPVHFVIELAVTETAEAYGQLIDKEVEFVYELYRKYFLALRQGKTPPEPSSTRNLRSILIDNIWDKLLDLEDNVSLVYSLTDGSFAPAGRPVTTMEEIYVMSFNDLKKSTRFWRKREGVKGYIRHIAEHVNEVLAQGANPLEDVEEANGLYFIDPTKPPKVGWLVAERGYALEMDTSLLEQPTGYAQVDALFKKIETGSSTSTALFAEANHLRQEISDLPILEQEWLRLVSDPENYDHKYDDDVRAILARYPNKPAILNNYLRAYILSTDSDDTDDNPHELMAQEAKRIGFPDKMNDFDPLPNGKYDPTDFFQFHNLAATFALYASPPDEHRAALHLNDMLRTNPDLSLLQGATSVFLSICTKRFLALSDVEEDIETPANFPDTPLAATYIKYVWDTLGDD